MNILRIDLTQKQTEGLYILQKEHHQEVLFDGGVRAGKTFLIVLYLFQFALANPGSWILIARRFLEHAKKSLFYQTIEPLLAKFPDSIYSVNKADWIIKFYNNSQVWLSGMDDSKRVNEIMGREYLMIFLNEATEISQGLVDKIKTRLAQKVYNPKTRHNWKSKLIFDCNPVNPEFWLNKRFLGQEKGKARLLWTPYDNRTNLPESYIEDLELSLGDVEKQRLLLGQWVGAGDVVYRNVTEGCIVEDYDIREFSHLVGGIDWGYISAFSLWGIKKQDKEKIQATCIAEVEAKGKITNEFLEEIEQTVEALEIRKQDFPLYCDHEKDRIEEAKRKGFRSKLAYKDISAGDSTVNRFDVRIHKDCPNVYRSMRFLLQERNKEDIIVEGKHLKVDDHCLSGDTEVWTVQGLKPIKALVGTEGYVYAWEGNRIGVCRYWNVRRTRKDTEVWKITLDDKKAIIATLDHQFMLRNGEWRQLQDLKENDRLMPFYTRKDSKGYRIINLNNGECIKAHRLVYQDILGVLGENHCHHKDGNIENNHPCNLEKVTVSEHCKKHEPFRFVNPLNISKSLKRRYKEDTIYREKNRQLLLKNQEKAKEWHRSEEGRIWHKKHGEETFFSKKEKSRRCFYCGVVFQTKHYYQKFCSNKCKSAYRRKIKADNISRICEYCGRTFETNKYEKSIFCSRRCAAIVQWFKKKQNHRIIKKEFWGYEDTFCLTTEWGNFFIDGILSKNCSDASRYALHSWWMDYGSKGSNPFVVSSITMEAPDLMRIAGIDK